MIQAPLLPPTESPDTASTAPPPIPGDSEPPGVSAPVPPPPPEVAKVLRVPIEQLHRDPDQPRKEFDADDLERLGRSMSDPSIGQLDPITIRTHPDTDGHKGHYLIIDGERRWRAARLVDMKGLKCVVRAGLDERQRILAMQLTSFAHRLDLGKRERAEAYRRLMELEGITQQQLADRLNISQAAVSRRLAFLEAVPTHVRGPEPHDEPPGDTMEPYASDGETAADIGSHDEETQQGDISDQAQDSEVDCEDPASQAEARAGRPPSGGLEAARKSLRRWRSSQKAKGMDDGQVAELVRAFLDEIIRCV